MPHTSKDATPLLHRARGLVEPDANVRDARISNKYIEFDTSISDNIDIRTIIERLQAIAPMANYEEIVERHMMKDKAIIRAIELFNEERYWEAHEALEYVWKNATGSEKQILNGIILVAAAFVHDEKDETDICISILNRARRKLDGTIEKYYGIDTNKIFVMISEIIKTGSVTRFTI